MKKIGILLVDDHVILRRGVRMLLSTQRDMRIVAEASNGTEAVKLAVAKKPDVAIVDLSMPGMSGLEVIERIRNAAPSVRVLVLTMHDDPAYAHMTIAAGAVGHVVKDADPSDLVTAIRAVHRGRTIVALTGGAPGAPRSGGGEPEPAVRASRREWQVLQLLARGHTNREIAELFALSVKTVETYRARLRDKLGLRRRADLVRFAISLGLLDSVPAKNKVTRRNAVRPAAAPPRP